MIFYLNIYNGYGYAQICGLILPAVYDFYINVNTYYKIISSKATPDY
jgi:hypothetical protein